MERQELRARLAEKVNGCWNAYVDGLLKQTPSVLISRAEEITAASFCYEQLTGCAGSYPDALLEYLLHFDDPLEAMREQWQEEQGVDLSDEFEHALWSLWNDGPEPETGPNLGGLTMEQPQ